MTLMSLTDGCRLLAIEAKTLRRWLALAHFSLQAHPTDARLKGLTVDQLRQVATTPRRTLADLPEALSPPVPACQPAEPPPFSPDLLEVLQSMASLSAQLVVLQQRLAELTPLQHLVQVPAFPCPAEPVTAMGEPTPAPAPPKPRPATSSSARRLLASYRWSSMAPTAATWSSVLSTVCSPWSRTARNGLPGWQRWRRFALWENTGA